MGADRSRLPALGPERPFTFPDIRRTTLPNGLQRVDGRAPPGAARRRPGAGAGRAPPSDPPDRPGLAAITGDMLDEGCGDRSALDVHEALGRIGAQLDLDVGHDATVLGLTTLERYLDRGLELVRDMLIRPRFEQREFDRVRDLRLNRLLQLKDMPPALADRAFTQLLYRNHPYGHLPIGSEGALRALMIRDITTFHRRAYVPARTTVIAVGDASHDALSGRGGARVRGLDARSRRSRSPIPQSFPAPAHADVAPGARPPRRRGAVGAARRPRRPAAPLARLSRRARRQHDPRRPVRQPDQHEPARGQGLHLRRAHGVRVPPRAGAVRPARQRPGGRDRRRAARSDRRDPRDSRRPSGDARRSSSSAARR